MANANPNPLPASRGRKKGSKNKRTALLDAVGEVFEEGEVGFWQKVCELAMAEDTACLQIIAKRLQPELQSVKVEVEGNLDVTDTARALGLPGTIRSTA